MNMYSQNDEERWILEAVGHLPTGRFLDIGANDGAYLSNTLALVERGWSGVLVEANPFTFTKLVERHGANPKLTLVNAAVGVAARLTQFWVATTDNGLSTTEEKQRKARAWQAGYREPFWVSMVRLEDLLSSFPGPIDFLSIDVEGTSVDLFAFFPLHEILPACICVEHDGHMEFCRGRARMFKYREVACNNENLIFVRE